MSLINNAASLHFCRTIFSLMGKTETLGKDRVPKNEDGLLLACVHLSHYDPFTTGVLLRKRVSWMARIESFQTPLSDWLTRNCGAFPIDRFGCSVRGVREGLRRLDQGQLVGIYPEGEVLEGAESVLNGAPMKEGVGLLARRADVPVVPCIMLNSEHLSNFVSWLPLRTGRMWLGFGEPLYSDKSLPPGRASRSELTKRLEVAFRDLHTEMSETFKIPAAQCPVRSYTEVGQTPGSAVLQSSRNDEGRLSASAGIDS